MVGKELYIEIKSDRNILRELKESKKNVYLLLYRVLEEIKTHNLKLDKLEKLNKKIEDMKKIVDILLQELPEVDNIEKLLKDIDIEYNQTEDEEINKEEIKEKKRKIKSEETEEVKKDNNKNVKDELGEISKELEDLKEELKKLLEY